MRTATDPQLQLGEIDIANIKIDPRSRDDIPQLLRGLQYLYSDNTLREEIFQILEKLPPKKVNTELGRPGMMWWKILVMGTLLFDAMRKIIALTADYARMTEVDGWRQSQFNIRQVKRGYRAAQQIKRSSSKDDVKKQKRQDAIVQTHQNYIDLARKFINKSQLTLAAEVADIDLAGIIKALEIQTFITHAERQIDQIERRIIKGEKILHGEKVF